MTAVADREIPHVVLSQYSNDDITYPSSERDKEWMKEVEETCGAAMRGL